MREILFRGKAINRNEGCHRTKYQNGEWVYGLVTKLYDEQFKNLPAEMTNTNGISGIEIDYKTIGQYTGVKDKNGKKIFEGDILEADVFKNLNRYKAVWTVEYKERFSQGNGYYFYGKNRRFNTRATQSIIINTHATVIGNIYDNPELLGDEENDSNDT